VKYAGWFLLGLLVGAAAMWLWDHKSLVQNRDKISGANQIIEGAQQLFGGA
jgi:hypothetical protein